MGRVEVAPGLEFEEADHRYFLDKVPVPGLTETLRLTGFIDPSWFTEEARDRGTRVHSACCYLAEDDLEWSKVASDILPRVQAFDEFLKTYTPELIYAEKAFVSRAARFACRIDFLFDVPALGGLSIIEVKTGPAGLAAKLQTAGQKVAIEENTAFKGIKRFGFELSKEGRYKFVPHVELEDRPMFLNAVSMVHRRINAGELKL